MRYSYLINVEVATDQTKTILSTNTKEHEEFAIEFVFFNIIKIYTKVIDSLTCPVKNTI